MSRTVDDLVREDVRCTFASDISSRGEDYFDEGLVVSVEAVDNVSIIGSVNGYNVSLSLDDNEVVCECSCPCDFNCKHAAALLFGWISEKSVAGKVNGVVRKSVKKRLEEMSKEEIVLFLELIFRRHKDLVGLLNIERGALKSGIRVLFSSFWDWRDMSEFNDRLNDIFDSVKMNSSVDMDFLNEMMDCVGIVFDNYENVHDSEDVDFFVGEWLGFVSRRLCELGATREEKKGFVDKLFGFVENKDYDFLDSCDNFFIGLCDSCEDVEWILGFLREKDFFYGDSEFVLRLYDNSGLDEEYIEYGKKNDCYREVTRKLCFLGRDKEALDCCDKELRKKLDHGIVEQKIKLLRKLGYKKNLKEFLFELCMSGGDFSNFKLLKAESSRGEWRGYLERVIPKLKKMKNEVLLSKIYYDEKDYKNAYEYFGKFKDSDYLELLARRLVKDYPKLACEAYGKLCFIWIEYGTGWCYKKAGKMLGKIKEIDDGVFDGVKEKVISDYGKKWSLMKIVKKL